METLADLVERLGGVPLSRIRLKPAPGTATEADVISIAAHEDRLCELVDGVLVEKPMGYEESLIAVAIIRIVSTFVHLGRLGKVTGADGMLKLFPGLIRIPDVAFVTQVRYRAAKVRGVAVPLLVPDLVVEVLSAGNTRKEMLIKRGEYFSAGVRLVWMVDPKTRTVEVYKSPDDSITLTGDRAIDGGDVLPGFSMSLHEIFAELDDDQS